MSPIPINGEGGGGGGDSGQYPEGGVWLKGYHKKFKTMKRKYFVLLADDDKNPARLEYYDSEKKFKSSKSTAKPKRTIKLKNCFNINRRLDTKYDYVIALSTREEVFCMVMDNEDEMNKWLKMLLILQRGEDTEADQPQPTYKHVWQVQIQRKGLAEKNGIVGPYYICLTTKSLTLMRSGLTSNHSEMNYNVDFPLSTIRRYGDSACLFYIEVGRKSAIGAGELWMETEDPLIAKNMHTMISSAIGSNSKNREDSIGPMRKRSSSANEASKPISVLQRRQTLSGNKTINSSPLSGGSLMGRERCDSLPSSRNRTISECSNHSITNPSMPPPRIPSLVNHRPHSMYTRHSHSPPMNNTLSPSAGCSESDGSSLSIDEPDNMCHSSTPDESGNFTTRYFSSRTTGSSSVIPEENFDDWNNTCGDNNHIHRSNQSISILDKLNNHGGNLTLPLHPIANYDIDNQDHYMELSPYGSSPHDTNTQGVNLGNYMGGAHMPISSPGNHEFHSKYPTSSTGNHSRSSSIAEEGYTLMLGDINKSTANKRGGGMNSNASTCSINSGSHLNDMRFHELPLEGIDSTFAATDEEELNSECDRPTRTYSVGSRLEYNKRRLPNESLIINQMDQNNTRVRAFSVGSRAKYPRCDREQDLFRDVISPSIISNYNNNNNTINANYGMTGSSGIGGVVVKGRKSTSAPILVHKSQSSVERMSDLMEIDFSHNSSNRSSASGSHTDSISSPITTTAVPIPFAPVPTSIAQVPATIQTNRTASNPVAVPFTRPRCGTFGSSPRKVLEESGYLEMKPGSLTTPSENGGKLSTSPLKSLSLTQKPGVNDKINTSDYLTMSPSNSNSLSSSTSSLLRSTSRNDRSSSTNRLATSVEKPMEIDSFPSTASGTPEGYMEMSWNNRGKNLNGITATRSPSMPIDINPISASGMSNTTPFMLEEDTRDEVDTPQQKPPTQFFFSPSSPVKMHSLSFSPKDEYNHHKCMVDATGGKVTLLSDVAEENGSEVDAAEVKILNTDTKTRVEALSNDYAAMSIKEGFKTQILENTSDYADMTCGKLSHAQPPVIEHDYVNMKPEENRPTSLTCKINGNRFASPLTEQAPNSMKMGVLFTRQRSEPRKIETKQINDSDGDYAIMFPGRLIAAPEKSFKPIADDRAGRSVSRPNSVNDEISSTISAASSTSTLCGSTSTSSSSASTFVGGTKSTSPKLNGNTHTIMDLVTSESANAFPFQRESIKNEDRVLHQPELHYAKLDLPPCSANNSSSNLASPGPSPVSVGVSPSSSSSSQNSGGASSTSPSPNSNVMAAPTFTYAKLDFNKIEDLKQIQQQQLQKRKE